MNVVQCLSHSIEEYDMLRMYSRIGVNVFSIGGYIDPAHPHDPKRPGVPEMPFFPQLKEAVDRQRLPDNLRAAQENIPAEVLEWADVIVFHHYLDRLYGQWPRIKAWLNAGSHRRVIWRTVGQSVDGNEMEAQQYVREGLEIVRYSPKERNIPNFAGEHALIRFAKDPADWYGWTGDTPVVGNVTQHMAAREPYCNAAFYLEATKGLNALPAGPGSEQLPGGIGELPYERMREYLRSIRAYLYTGTQPASYTLGLIEAMMTGVPVVSITSTFMRVFPYGPAMFEGAEIAGWSSIDDDGHHRTDAQHAANTREILREALLEPDVEWSRRSRERAIDLFGIDTVSQQWATFLDVKVPAQVAA